MSRYTEPEVDQAVLLQRLKISLPAQSPPRVLARTFHNRYDRALWCRPSRHQTMENQRSGEFTVE